MIGPFKYDHLPRSTAVTPPDFKALCPPPRLLPGEDLARYRTLQAEILQDLSPTSAIEWLLAIDIAELSWEIQRYRSLQHKLLDVYRQNAIEASLRRIDVAGILPEFQETAEYYTARNALDWKLDRTSASAIEARLAMYGFDEETINMEVYLQAREFFSLFEALLDRVQMRRLLLLKELNILKRTNSASSRQHGLMSGQNHKLRL